MCLGSLVPSESPILRDLDADDQPTDPDRIYISSAMWHCRRPGKLGAARHGHGPQVPWHLSERGRRPPRSQGWSCEPRRGQQESIAARTPPGTNAYRDGPASLGRGGVAVFRARAVPLPPLRTPPDASGRTKSTLGGGLPMLRRSATAPIRTGGVQPCGRCAARTETREGGDTDLTPTVGLSTLLQEAPPLRQRRRIPTHRVRRPQVPVSFYPLLNGVDRRVVLTEHRPSSPPSRRRHSHRIRHRCRSFTLKNTRR